jgi:hypothetical protein
MRGSAKAPAHASSRRNSRRRRPRAPPLTPTLSPVGRGREGAGAARLRAFLERRNASKEGRGKTGLNCAHYPDCPLWENREEPWGGWPPMISSEKSLGDDHARKLGAFSMMGGLVCCRAV